MYKLGRPEPRLLVVGWRFSKDGDHSLFPTVAPCIIIIIISVIVYRHIWMQVRLCLGFLFVCKTIGFHLNCSDPAKAQLQIAPILSLLYLASNISGLCHFPVAPIVEASKEKVIIVFGVAI